MGLTGLQISLLPCSHLLPDLNKRGIIGRVNHHPLISFMVKVGNFFYVHFQILSLSLYGSTAIGEEDFTGSGKEPVTQTLTTPPMLLALKSGNFGDRDFFRKAVEMMS